MGLASNLNAKLTASSIVGDVYSERSDISISRVGNTDYVALIGSGGNKIVISSVVGGVQLRQQR